MHSKKTAFIVEHDFIMATYLADRVIVFDGQPGVNANANTPESLLTGCNKFLRSLDVTFRRDPNSYRPRINKFGSQMDQEQKLAGNFVSLPGTTLLVRCPLTNCSSSWKRRAEEGVPKKDYPPPHDIPSVNGVLGRASLGGGKRGRRTSGTLRRRKGGLPAEECASDEDDDEDDGRFGRWSTSCRHIQRLAALVFSSARVASRMVTGQAR
ncbi:hypothetical protein IWZ01DRAFT_198080 [Phyllosticta capitalensis]